MATGMQGLLVWCKRITKPYGDDVAVKNMTTSWKNGLAFCALIHHFRPDLIDFSKLSKENIADNNELAFTTAEDELGIPALLDVEDMVEMKVPDRLSIMTYVSQYYNYFKDKVPGEIEARKSISKKRSLKSTSESMPAKRTMEDKDDSPKKTVPSVTKNTCWSCSKTVYLMERLSVEGHLFHRICFKCTICGKQLKNSTYEYDKISMKFYCTRDFKERCKEKESARTSQVEEMDHSVSDSNSLKDNEKTPFKRNEHFYRQAIHPESPVKEPDNGTVNIVKSKDETSKPKGKIKQGKSLFSGVIGKKNKSGHHEFSNPSYDKHLDLSNFLNRLSNSKGSSPEPPVEGVHPDTCETKEISESVKNEDGKVTKGHKKKLVLKMKKKKDKKVITEDKSSDINKHDLENTNKKTDSIASEHSCVVKESEYENIAVYRRKTSTGEAVEKIYDNLNLCKVIQTEELDPNLEIHDKYNSTEKNNVCKDDAIIYATPCNPRTNVSRGTVVYETMVSAETENINNDTVKDEDACKAQYMSIGIGLDTIDVDENSQDIKDNLDSETDSINIEIDKNICSVSNTSEEENLYKAQTESNDNCSKISIEIENENLCVESDKLTTQIELNDNSVIGDGDIDISDDSHVHIVDNRTIFDDNFIDVHEDSVMEEHEVHEDSVKEVHDVHEDSAKVHSSSDDIRTSGDIIGYNNEIIQQDRNNDDLSSGEPDNVTTGAENVELEGSNESIRLSNSMEDDTSVTFGVDLHEKAMHDNDSDNDNDNDSDSDDDNDNDSDSESFDLRTKDIQVKENDHLVESFEGKNVENIDIKVTHYDEVIDKECGNNEDEMNAEGSPVDYFPDTGLEELESDECMDLIKEQSTETLTESEMDVYPAENAVEECETGESEYSSQQKEVNECETSESEYSSQQKEVNKSETSESEYSPQQKEVDKCETGESEYSSQQIEVDECETGETECSSQQKEQYIVQYEKIVSYPNDQDIHKDSDEQLDGEGMHELPVESEQNLIRSEMITSPSVTLDEDNLLAHSEIKPDSLLDSNSSDKHRESLTIALNNDIISDSELDKENEKGSGDTLADPAISSKEGDEDLDTLADTVTSNKEEVDEDLELDKKSLSGEGLSEESQSCIEESSTVDILVEKQKNKSGELNPFLSSSDSSPEMKPKKDTSNPFLSSSDEMTDDDNNDEFGEYDDTNPFAEDVRLERSNTGERQKGKQSATEKFQIGILEETNPFADHILDPTNPFSDEFDDSEVPEIVAGIPESDKRLVLKTKSGITVRRSSNEGLLNSTPNPKVRRKKRAAPKVPMKSANSTPSPQLRRQSVKKRNAPKPPGPVSHVAKFNQSEKRKDVEGRLSIRKRQAPKPPELVTTRNELKGSLQNISYDNKNDGNLSSTSNTTDSKEIGLNIEEVLHKDAKCHSEESKVVKKDSDGTQMFSSAELSEVDGIQHSHSREKENSHDDDNEKTDPSVSEVQSGFQYEEQLQSNSSEENLNTETIVTCTVPVCEGVDHAFDDSVINTSPMDTKLQHQSNSTENLSDVHESNLSITWSDDSDGIEHQTMNFTEVSKLESNISLASSDISIPRSDSLSRPIASNQVNTDNTSISKSSNQDGSLTSMSTDDDECSMTECEFYEKKGIENFKAGTANSLPTQKPQTGISGGEYRSSLPDLYSTMDKRKAPPKPPRQYMENVEGDSVVVHKQSKREEMEKELQFLEVKQRELEMEGVVMEKKLRECSGGEPEDAYLLTWFELVNQKNMLLRRENELIYLCQEMDFLQNQRGAEFELRQLMMKPDDEKTEYDTHREEELLSEILNLVTKRSNLVDQMDEDRIREYEEDQEILSMMAAQGMKSSSTNINEEETSNTKEKKKKNKEKTTGKERKESKIKKSKEKVEPKDSTKPVGKERKSSKDLIRETKKKLKQDRKESKLGVKDGEVKAK